jgi:phenylpropionate dioxygenase-like ring-hydroxylating dioxygenase large terminal subunit
MTTSTPPIPDQSALAAAARVLAAAGHVADPFTTAEIFPGEAYTGEDFWRFERWAVFEREWLCIGHVNQVPNAGDHFAITVLDEKLVVGRGEDGALHVVSAICQHRGHPLMDGLAASDTPHACRNASLLVCPYHAWSYRLDGSLHAAPGMRQTATIEELRQRIRLPSIRHEIFEGLIFINFDQHAQPLAPRLGRMKEMIQGYGLPGLIPMEVASIPMRCNWKIYQENSLEPYHTDVVHKHSHNPAPANLSAFYPYAPGDGAIITTTRFAETAELFGGDAEAPLPQIAGLNDEQQGRLLFIAVLPMLFLLLEPGSVLVTLARPMGPESMELLAFSLYPEAAVQTPGFAEKVAAQTEALQVIVGEDIVTQEALQRGHRSRFTPKGVLSWLEATIPQMNAWLAERYRSGLDAALSARANGRTMTG